MTHAVVIQTNDSVNPPAGLPITYLPITQLAPIVDALMRTEAPGFERLLRMVDEDTGKSMHIVVFDSKEHAESWSSSKVTLDSPEESLDIYEVLWDK